MAFGAKLPSPTVVHGPSCQPLVSAQPKLVQKQLLALAQFSAVLVRSRPAASAKLELRWCFCAVRCVMQVLSSCLEMPCSPAASAIAASIL